jgi:hypothetical protein
MSAKLFDPVSILGRTPDEAKSLMRGHVVTPGEVEAVARAHYPWRKHLNDDSSYWVVTSQAARILGTSPAQVASMLRHRQLPFVTHLSGVRMMRRSDVIALAERANRTAAR